MTPASRGATTAERKTPDKAEPDVKAPESHAPETHAAENHAEGARTVTRPNGDRAEYNSAGKPTRLTTKDGDEARFDSRGQIRAIHTQDSTIRLGPRGGRTVVTERPDHTRLVSMGPHYGYVDHPVVRNGRPYLERTYVAGGRVYARAYPGYYYRGALYYHYVPAYTYAPAFYVWAVRPWHARAKCNWNWGPWYSDYASYFTPYPDYDDASLWLTDYVIAQQLQGAYESRQQAPPVSQPIASVSGSDANAGSTGAPAGSAPLSPEVKQAIAAEVTAQLAAEKNSAMNTQAASGTSAPSGDVLPDALNPSERTFIADISLDEDTVDGGTCSVGAGDVLTRVDTSPNAGQKVDVIVRSSQKGDCAAGIHVAVSVSDLQDMANHFHEKVDDGVDNLAKNQAQSGMPPAPPSDPVQVADAQAKPDLDAQRLLHQQQQSADQTEKNVQQSVNHLGAISSRFVDRGTSAALAIEGGGLGGTRFADSANEDAAILPSNSETQVRTRHKSSTP
ncbi:MAG: hypothetical protein WBF06_11660 [Candidatus Acidiferrales bacterium]